MLPPVYILIVNDRAADLAALGAALPAERGHQLLLARSATEALKLAGQYDVAVAILDIRMPEIDGFELAETLRGMERTRRLPIIFVSALDPTRELIDRVYGLGAVDFLQSPILPKVLQAKVDAFIDLHRKNQELAELARHAEADAHAELSTQQERFRLFMEAATDYGLFFTDPAGLITEWTRGAENVLGRPAEAVVGQHTRVIFTEEDQAAGVPEAEMERARHDGQASDERWHLRGDGSRIYAVGRMFALRDGGGVRGFAKILRDFTAQKKIEQQLEESLVRFRTLADNIAQLAWMTDAEGNIFWYNQRWFDYTGTTLEAMRGWGWRSVQHPQHLARVEQKFRDALARGADWEDTFPLRGRDGTYRWFLSRAVTQRDDKGQITGWFGTNTDIHEALTAQRALQESEAKFREIFTTANEGIWILNAEARIENVNARMADMLGYTIDEMLGRAKREFTAPEDNARIEQLWSERRRGVHAWVDLRFRHKSGREVWMAMAARPLFRDGKFAGALDMFTDITERRRAEQELLASRTQLHLAVDAAELGIFFHDEATGKTVWNDRMRTLIGLPPDTAPCIETFLARVHPEDRARVEQEWLQARAPGARGAYAKLEFRVVWPDGSVRHLHAAARALIEKGPGGNRTVHSVGAIHDITATKQFEQQLRTQVAVRTAALQEKTAQLEGFAYTVAHDLRSPLRAISGYADFILQDHEATLEPTASEYLRRIKAAAARLDDLINDLLAYSRIGQVELTLDDIPLQSSVDWAIQQLLPDIRAKHAVIEVKAPLPHVRGDRSVLDQVVVNLVSNALKFVPPGKTPEVAISATEIDGEVRLAVRDNGIGIAPEYHERIFKVFERLTTARDFPGTGVGLAIVARAAERLGGRIGVDSAPGRGSTFWIELRKAS